MSAKLLVALMSLTLTVRAELPAPKDLPSRAERPDPLAMFDGSKVTSPEQWQAKRKSELKELFRHMGEDSTLGRTMFPGILQLASIEDFKPFVNNLLFSADHQP